MCGEGGPFRSFFAETVVEIEAKEQLIFGQALGPAAEAVSR